jgi:hypothetical protein
MIEKNILFDLSRKKWLEKISLESKIQWYPIENLFSDIKKTIALGVAENNLVSAPISNRDIATALEPDLIEAMENNHNDPLYYDVRSLDNEYWISKEEIWSKLISCYSAIKTSLSDTIR